MMTEYAYQFEKKKETTEHHLGIRVVKLAITSHCHDPDARTELVHEAMFTIFSRVFGILDPQLYIFLILHFHHKAACVFIRACAKYCKTNPTLKLMSCKLNVILFNNLKWFQHDLQFI